MEFANASDKTKNILLFFILTTMWNPTISQTVDDPVGDVPTSDPNYLDITKMKFKQSSDKIYIDFYPNAEIPRGNQQGIDRETVFEVYMDVDSDSQTGAKIEDIGVDYILSVNLYTWNGKSWIDGNVYWDFNKNGSPNKQDGFFVYAGNLTSWRFRWEFSLISLKWSQIEWIAKVFYSGHVCDQIPDEGHAYIEIDTSLVADVDTTSGTFVEFIYPESYVDVLQQYEVIAATDAGAQVESQICGTEFNDILTVKFNPWLQGVAYSGNPVMMGSWGWGDEPSWFIILHELGHNFTLASVRFEQLYPGLGYVSMGGDDWNFGTNFCEAWATMVGLYAMQELFSIENEFQLGETCRYNLKQTYDQINNSYQAQLLDYEEEPHFSTLYPDLIDGIFLTLADSFGYEIIPYFFKVLQPSNERWDILLNINPSRDYDWSKTISMTVTCCAFSVAAGADLRDMFRIRWDFPIDDSLYSEIQPEIERIITGVDKFAEGRKIEDFRLLQNYPNPFNTVTTIYYKLGVAAEVTLKIFALTGTLITEIQQERQEPGWYKVDWHTTNISSGIYICSLETEYGVDTRKMVLLK